jgi:soluble lytic murein transglycosylase-like protein
MSFINEIYQSKLSLIQTKLDGIAARTGVHACSAFGRILSSHLSEPASQSAKSLSTEQSESMAVDTPSAPYFLAGSEGSGQIGTAEYDDLIIEAAQSYGMDPALIKAIIYCESNFDAQAVSSAGAQGLMQLMPSTSASMGVTNPFDPQQNIFGGAKCLSQLLEQFGDLRLALAAYNTGPARIQALNITDADDAYEYTKISGSVRGYVSKVLYYAELFMDSPQEGE